MNNCKTCRFSVSCDYGWSNYTVEGTVNHCGSRIETVRKNFEPFDNGYGKAHEFEKYNDCVGFESGYGIGIDVDQYAINNLTPEEKEIYDRAME